MTSSVTDSMNWLNDQIACGGAAIGRAGAPGVQTRHALTIDRKIDHEMQICSPPSIGVPPVWMIVPTPRPNVSFPGILARSTGQPNKARASSSERATTQPLASSARSGGRQMRNL